MIIHYTIDLSAVARAHADHESSIEHREALEFRARLIERWFAMEDVA